VGRRDSPLGESVSGSEAPDGIRVIRLFAEFYGCKGVEEESAWKGQKESVMMSRFLRYIDKVFRFGEGVLSSGDRRKKPRIA
jgi:hypothetical protein